MRLSMLKAKLHQATLTMTDLHYEGSIAIDEDLLEASGILANEKVDVWNITNGARLTTYALPAERGSREIMLNGAAARHAHQGDRVIITAFCEVEADEAKTHKPTVVLMNEDNSIKKVFEG
ncbi:aspartate 1-decarboxylase [Parvularcula sp. ZS-1/3]|uniref:Aspartate 1-decarboxylase n=1 Tax=Parvularcula mediterranea TaxID=2732508 RepID=A0A7Y3W3Z3_9PROT|nr:aspartate 1-decarboxylase [Parvularcula mediterranea]NNU14722.1 aspartate 1-decarboxylase [Parvularcula mediterranea]